jgi:hypothetical protein
MDAQLFRKLMDAQFSRLLQSAIEDGLVAAALVDRKGNVIARAGAIEEEEAMPLAALVMYRLKSDDLAPRLFAGQVLSIALDGRDVAVAVAKRQLFVVAVLAADTPAVLDLVAQRIVGELRDRVSEMLQDMGAEHGDLPPWGGGPGGSGSGPAELPLIEFGITVPRKPGKA